MSDIGYFHVLLALEGEDDIFALYDLSEAELMAEVVQPYNQGNTLRIGNSVMALARQSTIRILLSSEHSKVLLERELKRRIDADAAANREPNGVVLMRPHSMGPEELAGLSANVTQRYIRRLPGSNPDAASRVLNHPRMLAVIAVVVSGLVVAFLARQLGFT